MDPTYSTTPLLLSPSFHGGDPPIMETNVPKSLHLPCLLCQNSGYQVSPGCHSRGRGRWWLALRLFSRRVLSDCYPKNCRRQGAQNIPRPIPWIITRHQVPPCCPRGLPTSAFAFRCFRFHLFVSPLEDVSVEAYERFADPNGSDGQQTPVQTPNPPKFSGLLELALARGLNPFICRLLSLPNDLHFRILTLKCVNEGDISSVAAMVDKCSHTLECLRIYDRLPGVFFQCLALPRND